MRITPPRRAARRRPRGFTLVELSLAMTILVVGLMAMSASTLRMHDLRRQNRERTIAQNAVRTMYERVHAASEVAKSGPGSWADGLLSALAPDGAPGSTFTVGELTPLDPASPVGDVLVITDETLSDEDTGFELGMPRDLDGDGLVSNTDVSATARILPVVVRTRWQGVSGQVQIVHPFFVMGY